MAFTYKIVRKRKGYVSFVYPCALENGQYYLVRGGKVGSKGQPIPREKVFESRDLASHKGQEICTKTIKNPFSKSDTLWLQSEEHKTFIECPIVRVEGYTVTYDRNGTQVESPNILDWTQATEMGLFRNMEEATQFGIEEGLDFDSYSVLPLERPEKKKKEKATELPLEPASVAPEEPAKEIALPSSQAPLSPVSEASEAPVSPAPAKAQPSYIVTQTAEGWHVEADNGVVCIHPDLNIAMQKVKNQEKVAKYGEFYIIARELYDLLMAKGNVTHAEMYNYQHYFE